MRGSSRCEAEYYGVFPGRIEATIVAIIVDRRVVYIHLNVVVFS
jgi:hypothetical protein